ncbi:biogenesis of lysosome-related organelles complex 1 subunit 3 isoform X2 [Parasteatoda tepidariorum]|nr:biogenesis of lysosome-related organelles complex 1 subunit 3 isoform X2 [Parasteatoda tepidariorum]
MAEPNKTHKISNDYYLESEDDGQVILPSFKEHQKDNLRIPHGIVISGEASESDDEIDTHHAIPLSASDLSVSPSWEKNFTEPSEKTSSAGSSTTQHNTLLHKKLREKNQVLRKNIVELVTQPYESASKEIHNISQQLIKSQLLVQELRNTIRRLTNDLFDMEDKMEALRTGSFLPNMYEPTTSE